LTERVRSSNDKQEHFPEKLMPNSRVRPRRDSLNYFCDQLAELKKNVNKLITVINDRNPEENKCTPVSCDAAHTSLEMVAN
jgi:ubiquinone biosynthesis protein UbiJ